jgi:hypothetical protein
MFLSPRTLLIGHESGTKAVTTECVAGEFEILMTPVFAPATGNWTRDLTFCSTPYKLGVLRATPVVLRLTQAFSRLRVGSQRNLSVEFL